MVIKFKKLTETAIIPAKAHPTDAGFDLYADEDCLITPMHNKKVSTGIAMEIPEGYFGGVYARSGLATKQSLRPANCVGIIDSAYRGEIIIALHNDNEPMTFAKEIHKGDRIAQLIIQPCPDFEIEIVDELSDTDRGEGGFGSTGE